MKKTKEGRLSGPCRSCSRWTEIRDKVRLAELVSDATSKLEARWADKEFKPSLSDYLKLLQMEKELEEEKVKEIKVTWVVPTEE